jgi:L-cysteine S-thiosulfotransferase
MDLRHSRSALAILAGGFLGALLLGVTSASAASPDAKKLFDEHCQQCHQAKGIDNYGNVGPSLVDLKARYPKRDDVVAIVNDETKRNPETVMPPFGRNLILSKKEIDTIVDFLYSQ